MFSPKVCWSVFYFLLIFLSSNPAFAFLCPHCQQDSLNCQNGNIVCSGCNSQLFPEQLLPSDGQRPLLRDSSIPDATSLDATNQLMCHNFDLTIPGVVPFYILSPQQVAHLVAYVRSLFQDVSTSPHFLFTSITMAQVLVLSTPALENLSTVGQIQAIWWLAVYWLLYQNRGTQAVAHMYLDTAPDELNLSSALQNINGLQGTVQNQLNLQNLTSLFESNNTLLVSNALAALSNLASTNSHLAYQANYPGGIIVVMHTNGLYYILTPYNRYYLVNNARTAARILARIAQTQHPLGRAGATALQLGMLATLGTILGVITGAPLVPLALIGGVSPADVIGAYSLWITIVSAGFTAERIGTVFAPAITDDLSELDND